MGRSKRSSETFMSDHQDQIILPATAARGAAFINVVNSHSLAYGDNNVMDDDNLVTALSVQIHAAEC